jgi:hypothetical protein
MCVHVGDARVAIMHNGAAEDALPALSVGSKQVRLCYSHYSSNYSSGAPQRRYL